MIVGTPAAVEAAVAVAAAGCERKESSSKRPSTSGLKGRTTKKACSDHRTVVCKPPAYETKERMGRERKRK